MDDNWQPAPAGAHFAELVPAAVEGKPQFIRRRDGNEVVLVSRAYFDRTKMSLKDYLPCAQIAGYASDTFDERMRPQRRRSVYSRYRCRQQSAPPRAKCPTSRMIRSSRLRRGGDHRDDGYGNNV